MEPQSKPANATSLESVDSDSALGTLSDTTPDDEGSKKSTTPVDSSEMGRNSGKKPENKEEATFDEEEMNTVDSISEIVIDSSEDYEQFGNGALTEDDGRVTPSERNLTPNHGELLQYTSKENVIGVPEMDLTCDSMQMEEEKENLVSLNLRNAGTEEDMVHQEDDTQIMEPLSKTVKTPEEIKSVILQGVGNNENDNVYNPLEFSESGISEQKLRSNNMYIYDYSSDSDEQDDLGEDAKMEIDETTQIFIDESPHQTINQATEENIESAEKDSNDENVITEKLDTWKESNLETNDSEIIMPTKLVSELDQPLTKIRRNSSEDNLILDKEPSLSSKNSENEMDEPQTLDAVLFISKSGIVEEYVKGAKEKSPQKSKMVEQKIDESKGEITSVGSEEIDTSEFKINEGVYNEKDLDHSNTSVSPLPSSAKEICVIDAPLEDNISLIDSEEEGSNISDSDLVVSAAMQFNLATSSASECNGNLKDAKENHGLSSSPGGVPIQVKHVKKQQSLPQEEISGIEGDVDANSADEAAPLEEDNSTSVDTSFKLPDTVTELTTEDGSCVYLVGTAHFSKESQADVANTIRMVHPDIVMVELCKSRTAVLQLDEETILKESKSLDFNKMCVIIRQHGKVQGILYLLLLSVSAHITKQLGMAPGGEFRTAFSEARRSVPGCIIQLGDRPIQITLARALASLPIWQKVKLMWHFLTFKEPISKEEIEKCKQKDFMMEMLADMTGQFPTIIEVFVKERDIYLTHSLQSAAKAVLDPSSPTGFRPRVVVGVVGIGHVLGITEHWGKITSKDIPPIMKIPPPNLSDRVVKFTFKVTIYGLVGFGIYKCIPSSVKSWAHGAIEKNLSSIPTYFTKYFD